MKDQIKDFILSVGANDSSAALDTFNDIMSQKIYDAIEDRRQEIAGNMFQEVEEGVAGYEAFEFLKSINALDKNDTIADFFTLSQDQIGKLNEFGKKKKYRANSSSGKSYSRSFYDHLNKQLAKYLKG